MNSNFQKKFKNLKKIQIFEKFKFQKKCNSLPFGPTPDLSNLLQQSGACYLEIKLPSRLVVCKTRFYLLF